MGIHGNTKTSRGLGVLEFDDFEFGVAAVVPDLVAFSLERLGENVAGNEEDVASEKRCGGATAGGEGLGGVWGILECMTTGGFGDNDSAKRDEAGSVLVDEVVK